MVFHGVFPPSFICLIFSFQSSVELPFTGNDLFLFTYLLSPSAHAIAGTQADTHAITYTPASLNSHSVLINRLPTVRCLTVE